ncbi:MAG: YwbE family protein [Desulfobacterales bacterium]|jgi:uncharacterized protein YwbE|nr:YwbE family protein [Desulfobacterales bacterium]
MQGITLQDITPVVEVDIVLKNDQCNERLTGEIDSWR